MDGSHVNIDNMFELREPHVYGMGRPYSIDVGEDSGIFYEPIVQHAYKNDSYHGRLFGTQFKFVFLSDGAKATSFTDACEWKLFKIG